MYVWWINHRDAAVSIITLTIRTHTTYTYVTILYENDGPTISLPYRHEITNYSTGYELNDCLINKLTS